MRSPSGLLRRSPYKHQFSPVRLRRGLDRRSATSIVASYACSFRLRRFASPLEKQSRLWRPVNSNQRFEYDRLVRGCFMRHWRIAAHLPLHPFGCTPLKEVSNVRRCRGLKRVVDPRPLHPFGHVLRMQMIYYESKNNNFQYPQPCKGMHPKGSKGRPESPLEATLANRNCKP